MRNAPGEPHPRSVRAWFRLLLERVWHANRGILLGATLIVVTGFGLEWALSLPGLMRDIWYWPSFEFLFLFAWLPLPFALLFGCLAVRDNSGRFLPGLPGWKMAWMRFRAGHFSASRFAGALLAGGAAAVVINAYGSWKRVLPQVAPFSWDARFARWDSLLHGGRQPWEWLQPLLGHPGITTALDAVYFKWLPVFGAVIAWQAWSGRTELRVRFFFSVFFVWIVIGGVLATAFSSAGPCYFEHVVADANPYQNLLRYLDGIAATGFHTRSIQAGLWTAYATNSATPYTGIAAMPSVHVAMPVLYALVGWSHSRLLGTLFALYAATVLVATVHLGWHYAIDGYASGVLVVAWWVLLGKWRSVRGNLL